MRRHLFFAFLFTLPAGVFFACVGDDPNPASSSGDAGGDQSSSSDAPGSEGATSDSSPPDDAGEDTAKPYDIAALPGVRLWLESTKQLVPEAPGSTGLGSWTDSSGRWDAGADGAPDGGKHVALPHDVNAPSIVANGFGGRPTVSFTSGNGYLHVDNHPDFQVGTGDFVIVEVAKVTSGNGPLWLLRPNLSVGSEQGFFPGKFCVTFGMRGGDLCTTPVYTPSTEPHVFAARRKSDVFTLRVDGSVRATLDRTGSDTNIVVNQFSQPYAFIGNGVTMQVSELVVIVGPTSDPDLATLEGYLKGKYLIP